LNLISKILKRGLQAWLPCYLLLFSCASTAGQSHILLLLSGSDAPYQHFRQAFEQNLPPGARLEVHDLMQQKDVPAQADLLVTVGTKAAQWAAANSRGPLLATMLTSPKFCPDSGSASRNPNQFPRSTWISPGRARSHCCGLRCLHEHESAYSMQMAGFSRPSH